MATANGLKFAVVVNTEPALRAFRQSRKEIRQVVKATMQDVGDRVALPIAQRNAPRILRNDIIVKATVSDAYFTSRARMSKKMRGRFWYLNNGGFIRKPFVARRPVPIMQPGGGLIGFRMSVKRARFFRGKEFLQKSAAQARPLVVPILEREIAAKIQMYIDQSNVFRQAA